MIEPNTRFVGGPVQSTAARLSDRSVKFLIGTVVDYAGVIRAFTADFGVIGDLRLRIDPAATTILENGVAWAPADFHHQDGSRFDGCPRWRLQRVVAALADAGLTARTCA